jgi:hypothetical protein
VGDGEGKRAEGARSLGIGGRAGAAGKAQTLKHTREERVTGCNRSICYLGRLSRESSASNKDRKTRCSGRNGKKSRSRLRISFRDGKVRARPLLKRGEPIYIPSYWLKDEVKIN